MGAYRTEQSGIAVFEVWAWAFKRASTSTRIAKGVEGFSPAPHHPSGSPALDVTAAASDSHRHFPGGTQTQRSPACQKNHMMKF